MRKILIALAMVFALPALAFDIPKSTGKVTDNANVLTKQEVSALTERLKTMENILHVQMGILTVPKLPEEGIEEFANQTFHSWGIGQKGVDNGLLLVVAPNDRKMRLEVGYGLEAAIPDGEAAKIIDSMKPSLKAKKWAAAFNTAIDGVITKIPTKEEAATSPVEEKKATPVAETKPKKSNPGFWFGIIGSLATIWLIVAWLRYRAAEKRERELREEANAAYERSKARMKTYTANLDAQQRWNSTYNSKTYYAPPKKKASSDFGTGFVAGAATESLLDTVKRRRDEDDSSNRSSPSSWGSSSDSSSSWGSSDSGSSWGGGDSGGGGASGDW